MSTYEERLDEARRYNREWKRTERNRINGGLRALARYHGQRVDLSDYQRQKLVRMENNGCQTPSLPTVSILEKDLGLTNADYYAGREAMREAGL
jgi:hypothetical protein